jgi:hypothetical protein
MRIKAGNASGVVASFIWAIAAPSYMDCAAERWRAKWFFCTTSFVRTLRHRIAYSQANNLYGIAPRYIPVETTQNAVNFALVAFPPIILGWLIGFALVALGRWIRTRFAQAVRCRRRHQPRRPPHASIRPGSPAPAMGPGTAMPLLATA